MKLGLKGIIDNNLYIKASSLGFESFAFDLRPKSFNFTQEYKIVEILGEADHQHEFILLFENEKEFMLEELVKRVTDQTGLQVFPEITGGTSLDIMDKLEVPYIWHFNTEEKIASLSERKNLKRIVLNQNVLEEFQQRGELFGFLQLMLSEEDYEIEIALDWEQSIFLSIVEQFSIDQLSFEINNKIEKSYRNIDYGLLEIHTKDIKNYIENNV